MAKQIARGTLMGALGEAGRKGVASAKTKETKYPGGGRLPAGIEGGVARLTKCYFAKYDNGEMKGKHYFRCEAVMLKPVEHEGIRVKGMHTSFMEPVCDTPKASGKNARKTIADHLEHVINQMAILGVDRTELAEDGSDLEDTAEALQKAQPFFTIRTWKGGKQEMVKENGKVYVQDAGTGKNRKGPYTNEQAAKVANPYVGQDPRTNEVWGAFLPDYVPEESDAVEDNSAGNGEVVTDDTPPDTPAEGEDQTPAEGVEQADDWGTLAVEADGGDKGAAVKLTAAAKEAGVDPKAVKGASNWQEVAQMIRDATGTTEGGEGGEGEAEGSEGEAEGEGVVEWEPATDLVVKFKPLDKNKKPVKTAIDVLITAVDAEKKTVTLKNIDDNKTIYKNVVWDRLIHD